MLFTPRTDHQRIIADSAPRGWPRSLSVDLKATTRRRPGETLRRRTLLVIRRPRGRLSLFWPLEILWPFDASWLLSALLAIRRLLATYRPLSYSTFYWLLSIIPAAQSLLAGDARLESCRNYTSRNILSGAVVIF